MLIIVPILFIVVDLLQEKSDIWVKYLVYP